MTLTNMFLGKWLAEIGLTSYIMQTNHVLFTGNAQKFSMISRLKHRLKPVMAFFIDDNPNTHEGVCNSLKGRSSSWKADSYPMKKFFVGGTSENRKEKNFKESQRSGLEGLL